MIRRRNFARTLAAAFLLAAAAALLLLLLLPSAPGHAQTTTNTYVSNINQGSDNDWSDTVSRVQTFTTGSRTGGYTVTSVDIGYEDAEGDKFSAAIWTVDSDNEPDDGDNNNKVADLTAPTGTWSAGDTLTFTAPAGTTLDAGTTYAVVLTMTGNAVRLDSTTSDDEDSGAFSGWSIADTGYFISSNTWTANPTGKALRIAIKGTTAAANTPATSAPTISGTAQVGQTLMAFTADISDNDGLTSVSYAYQWIRVDGNTEADISGATASTYTLVAADLGKTIKVKVSFTDDASNAETLTSAATTAVTAAATTTNTYVSNINQGSDDDAASSEAVAQRFTTGSQSGGYTVTSVDIGYDDAGGDKFSAAIYTVDSDGYPDSEVFALTAPTGSWSTGTLTFTAPANSNLAASTTYTVRMSPTGNAVRLDTTRSTDEDSGAFSGWSIQDTIDAVVSGSWIHSSLGEIIRIAIKGSTAAKVDDCAGDTTTTCSVSPGTPVTGDIEILEDTDYFSLSVTSGVTYRIDGEGSPTSKGTLADPIIFLRDASDNYIDSNDDGGTGLNALLTWTADRTGTVYVVVAGANNSAGTYTLAVSASAPDGVRAGAPTTVIPNAVCALWTCGTSTGACTVEPSGEIVYPVRPDVRGIWSDGNTFYVIDKEYGKKSSPTGGP